jgi:hypothetical protein
MPPKSKRGKATPKVVIEKANAKAPKAQAKEKERKTVVKTGTTTV